MLEFKKIGDDLPNWVECKEMILPNGRIIVMGITPVIFGMRVKVGYKNDGGVELDYCAGADQSFLEKLYFIIEKALINTEGNFAKFPIQHKKPVIYDSECYPALIELAGGYPEEVPDLPSIGEMRLRFLLGELGQNA